MKKNSLECELEIQLKYPYVKGMISRLLSFCFTALLLATNGAFAKSPGELLDLHVLTGWQNANGTHTAALRIILHDGWKTYWRAPGEAGIPPRFDWLSSENLAAVEVSWPTPKLISTNGARAIGYERSVTLPLTLTPDKKGQSITLSGQIDLGICKEICVPVTVAFSQKLPMGISKRDPRIVAALAERPYSAAEGGVTRVACRISPIEGGLRLTAEIDLPSVGGSEAAIVETDNPDIWVSQPKTTREGKRFTAEAELFHANGSAFALNRSGLRITVLGQSHAVDIQGCPSG